MADPTEDGATEYDGPERFQPQAAVHVGLSSEQPFRVFRLEDPARVVIDVQHP